MVEGRLVGDLPLVDVTLHNPRSWQRELIRAAGDGGLAPPQPQRGKALIDTGAAMSMVVPVVADRLRAMKGPATAVQGLHPSAPWKTEEGAAIQSVHVEVRLGTFTTTVTMGKLPFGDVYDGEDLIALLGIDVLEQLEMEWSGPNRRFVLRAP